MTGQIKQERNFHIFYQLTKGASAAQREAYGLQGPEAYAYTSKSGCLEVPGIDDTFDWAETLKAMSIVGLSQGEQDQILRMLASVLWIGNVEFKVDQEGNAQVKDDSVTAFVAYLLEVDRGRVEKALTSRVMETQRGGRRGKRLSSPRSLHRLELTVRSGRFGLRSSTQSCSSEFSTRCTRESNLQQLVRMDRRPSQHLDEEQESRCQHYRCFGYLRIRNL